MANVERNKRVPRYQDDTTPSFFPDSESYILGLSNKVSFVSEFHWKGCEIQLKIVFFLARL